MIIAQLGRRDAPYIYVDVIDEERYSATIDRHFNHRTVNIGYSYNGPTEIGGLILLPDYRRVPSALVSSCRTCASCTSRCTVTVPRTRCSPSSLPPLEPDGTSHLWTRSAALYRPHVRRGRSAEQKNKEFIQGALPGASDLASLLPKQRRT